MIKKRLVRISMLLTFCIITLPVLNSNANEKKQCISKQIMIEVIETIPKKFPVAEKDNVFTITSNSNGNLTATVDGLSLTFFDSRDNDKNKWGTISNGYKNDGLSTSLEEIGCVIAGMNNYETGKVNKSKDAVKTAQIRYNDLIKLTQKLSGK